MSNHSSDIDPEMAKKFDDLFDKVVGKYKDKLEGKDRLAATDELMTDLGQKMGLGATGEMPDGQLTERDQGELKLAVATIDRKVIMNFGQPVAWIGLKPDQARAVAQALLTKADEAEQEAFKETMTDG